jgi:hypothetical protein
MKNPSMREWHHGIPAKGQDHLAPESPYLADFNSVTESLETAMGQCVTRQATVPKAATPAPSS